MTYKALFLYVCMFKPVIYVLFFIQSIMCMPYPSGQEHNSLKMAWLDQILSVKSWASYLTCLHLSFLI